MKTKIPLPLILLLALLLTSCGGLRASATPGVSAFSPSPTPLPGAPEWPETCDPALQARAMRPGQSADWAALALNACYELKLDLGDDPGAYSGSARVTFTNRTGENLDELVFRTYPNAEKIYGGSLEVIAIRVEGESLDGRVFLDDGTGLRLALPSSMAPGEATTVEMDFRGHTPIDLQGFPQAYGIFNLATEPTVLTLANWYPILADWDEGGWRTDPVDGIGDAVVSETALYHVQIEAPEDWTLVTTGTRVESEITEGRATARFVSGPVREFLVLAGPAFVPLEEEADGVTVRHWGLPGGEARWQEALQATVHSLQVFGDRFGPYPYAELDVAAVPLDNASGVEYPGVFLLLDTLYGRNPQRPFYLGLVTAHEAAHQWWYGVVGSDVLRHPWQDEGLTTFSSSLYQEEHQPTFYEGTLQFYQQAVDQLGPSSADNALDQPVEAFQGRRSEYGPVVYEKGALFFQALRERLGDETFFAALQTYYDAFRFRQAEPGDLLAAFEGSCGCELDDFYREWGLTP